MFVSTSVIPVLLGAVIGQFSLTAALNCIGLYHSPRGSDAIMVLHISKVV